MRTAFILSLLVGLAGCAVVPPAAWTFDPDQPRTKLAVPAQEFAAMADRVGRLQAERRSIRARIATQRDAWQRQREYEQLHRVGMELSLLERKLGGLASAP